MNDSCQKLDCIESVSAEARQNSYNLMKIVLKSLLLLGRDMVVQVN